MALKATPEMLEHIAAAIGPLDTDQVRDAYRRGDIPRADTVKDLDRRYRHDLFYAAGLTRYACDVLYPAGLTDKHIDSALRTIVRPL